MDHATILASQKKHGMIQSIAVTTNDYHRLMGLMELTYSKGKLPAAVTRLYHNLAGARTFSQETIDPRVITMNSRVHLRDLNNQRATEITLTYPTDAEPRDRKVSVLSTIGAALFGHEEKEIVSWNTPGGIGLFEIVKVTYQPESAGHYYL